MQKRSMTTIHHDEKHDFFFHLVNSATMEINYEDILNILTVWSIVFDHGQSYLTMVNRI